MAVSKRKAEKGKKVYTKNQGAVHRIAAIIPSDLANLIFKTNSSMNKAVNDALEAYFRDHYRSKLETALFTLYEVMFDLEKLKDMGKIGSIQCSDEHLLQIESYKEAIRILENSPLYSAKA